MMKVLLFNYSTVPTCALSARGRLVCIMLRTDIKCSCKICRFSQPKRVVEAVLGPNYPLLKYMSITIFAAAKQPERETDHSIQSSAEVKNN
jgi:hypothetical protein